MSKSKPTPKSKKATYRVRNWAAYNRSLVSRGSVTVWIDEAVIANWHPEPPDKRQRGGQAKYSDRAIECLLMLKSVYGLPYRQTIGFAQSIFHLMGAEVKMPDYTLLCKRSADLTVDLAPSDTHGSKHIVVDSTGLKIYGEGEWKVRQHGYTKRRTWRKFHLSADETTHELQAVVVTEANVDDAEAGKKLLAQTPGVINQVSGDGSYDKRKFYAAAAKRKVKRVAIPPRRDAKIWQHGNSKKAPLPRDENLRYIRRKGRKKWKRDAGYHRRSLAETAVYRFKTIFGNTLSTRTLPRQATEVRIKSAALNRMTRLGMPDSYRVS
jgi:hypothetical protein